MLPIVTNCCQFPSFCGSISRNIAIFLCGTSLTTALFNWVIYVAQISSNISRAVGGLMNGLPFKPFMRKGCLPLDVSANYMILNHVCETTHKFQKTYILISNTYIDSFFYIQFHLNQHIQNSVNQLDMNLNNSYLKTNWGFQTKGDPQSSPIPSTRHDRADQLPLGWVAPVGSQCERSAEDVGKSDPGDLWSRLVGFLKGDQCFCWLDFLDLARDLVGRRKKL